MPTAVLQLAALLSGLIGPPGTVAELPSTAEVVAESLPAHVEPDATSVAPERLKKGEKVRVVDADLALGWLTIEPPASAFAWVDRSAVRNVSKETAQVVATSTLARAGVTGARLPGPPLIILKRGAIVRRLDRPELVVGTGRNATTWLAVAPEPGQVRYVRAEGVVWPITANPEPAAVIRVSLEDSKPGSGKTLLPEIASIEAQHLAVLQEPMERWQFSQVRARYEGLIKTLSDPEAVEAVRHRLDEVARHEEIARSARTFQTIVERSRRRDQEVAMTRHRLAQLEGPGRRPFVAEGLLQPSSREVDGRRVYALIGREGNPVAFLDVPPGLDARSSLAKRVGVRGSVRYNEALGTRLIAVKDLEALE